MHPAPLILDARQSRALRALGLLLAAVAGGVDALGWLTLDHVFTAHMSGNTVGLTVHVALGAWPEVAKRAAVVGDFLLGLAAGAAVATTAHRRGSRRGFVHALGIEAAILLALIVAAEVVTNGSPVPRSSSAYFPLLALPAFAMGIQSATVRRIEPAHARTTYITGVLTRLVENLVAWAAEVWQRRRRGRASPTKEAIALRRAGVLASIWMAYASGGVAAALLGRTLGMRAFLLPLALLLVAIALDLRLARAGVAAAGPEEG